MKEKKEVYKIKPLTEGKKNIIANLIEEYDIKTTEDIQEALKDLLGGTIKSMLEAEMDEHIGYRKYQHSDGTNYRNGTKKKNVRSTYGEFQVDIPQDRNSTFDPQIVKKRQKDISEIDHISSCFDISTSTSSLRSISFLITLSFNLIISSKYFSFISPLYFLSNSSITLGLLYRANRCIIVGDPLQVEPVMTVTSTLIRAIANKYRLNELKKEFNIAGKIFNYTSPSLSIQTLADYANLYYGKIGETEVGCPLVVHRRCLSPMFDISNKISYDNRMINKCMPDKVKVDYVLEKNDFLDVEGQEKGNGDHYVKKQGDKIIEIIKNSKVKVFEKNKNLYIISPFTTVINGLKKDIKKEFKDEKNINIWCDNCLGTVHKFQGKDADSVILLLGCDENSKTSAQWAAQQANILNVAATRAKKRFVIIGDYNIWGEFEFFKDAKEILDDFNKE